MHSEPAGIDDAKWTTPNAKMNAALTAKEIAELIKGFLKERGLELAEEKTHITHIDDGFDFLGWNPLP